MEQVQRLFDQLLSGADESNMPSVRQQLPDLSEWPPEQRRLAVDLAERVESAPSLMDAWAWARDLYSIPSDVSTQLMIQDYVQQELHRSTVAFIDEATGKAASGVLLLVSDRLFVLTVSHGISPGDSYVFATSDDDGFSAKFRPPIVGGWRTPGDRPDVGYLEIEPKAAETLSKTAIGLNRVGPCGPGDPEKYVYVCGYPNELIRRWRDSAGVEHINFQAQIHRHVVIESVDWGCVTSQDPTHQPDPAFDMIIPYNQDEDMVDEKGRPTTLTDAFGKSGGGWWQGTSLDDLWSPNKYKLVGIQSRWPSNGRYIQATQVIHWLRMFWNKAPELRDHLLNEFPDQLDNG